MELFVLYAQYAMGKRGDAKSRVYSIFAVFVDEKLVTLQPFFGNRFNVVL